MLALPDLGSRKRQAAIAKLQDQVLPGYVDRRFQHDACTTAMKVLDHAVQRAGLRQDESPVVRTWPSLNESAILATPDRVQISQHVRFHKIFRFFSL